MHASSRRAIPGVFASMLLAAPLLALHPRPAAADPYERGHQSADPAIRAAAEARRPLGPRAREAARGRREGVTAAFADDGATWHQSGLASWYGGPRWQGQRTAAGGRYEQDALTAAHATLPLGSRVRVSTASGRSVVVIINDRPGTRRRVIDLSRGAAAALGILDRGVAPVTLSLL
jgi:rare lipoprotein A (peptidoglycan hydrolase)